MSEIINGFDVFAALKQPGATLNVHNIKVIDIQPSESGHELMTVEYAGATHELIGGAWSEEFSRRDVGKFGCLVPANPVRGELPMGACHFYAYLDQSLRRVPELDRPSRANRNNGHAQEVIGWRCDGQPNGFRAPVGIIPGLGGRFVADESVAVTLRVPIEFVRECQRAQMTPEELLRSFAGDLAGIQNLIACPRADGCGSNGSDERDYADAWFQRAHGWHIVDLYEIERHEEEAKEKQAQRDDFADLLGDFESYGGKADDLFAAVQALVDKQYEDETVSDTKQE